MSPGLYNVYIDAAMKEVKLGMGRRGESRDCMTTCMQMTWLRVRSNKKT